MQRLFAIIALVASACLAGCFSPSYENGHLRCTAAGQCPHEYHCASDDTCWKNGQDPAPVDGGGDDGGVVDVGDMTAPPDLLVPADLSPIVVPPAAVWIAASGGGVVGAASQRQLGLSVGGTTLVGAVTATSGAKLTCGYFSSDTN